MCVVKWQNIKKLQVVYIYDLKVLFCSVVFNSIRKLKYQGTHLEGGSVRRVFHLGFTPVTAAGWVGDKLVKRMAERLRQQKDNKRDEGALSILPCLSSSSFLPCSLGGAVQGHPTKAFQSHWKSISSPNLLCSPVHLQLSHWSLTETYSQTHTETHSKSR